MCLSKLDARTKRLLPCEVESEIHMVITAAGDIIDYVGVVSGQK